MKTIKIDRTTAQKLLNGSHEAVFIMYDDKNISVNDSVALVEKAKTDDPNSWEAVATALIDKVAEKRLEDLSADELQSISASSHENLLQICQQQYGAQVDRQTPIKLLYLTLGPASSSAQTGVKPIKLAEGKLFADGGSRGNPGPSASGFVIFNMDGKIVVKKGIYLGLTTNNQAEYQALKLGLEEAKRLGVRKLHVYMDSLLVINQMIGVFKIKNRDLWPIYSSIKEMLPDFEQISFTHVPRELNKDADSAVNEALDNAATLQ